MDRTASPWGVRGQFALPVRNGSREDFPLNRVFEDVFCLQPNKIGVPVCLRLIPIVWSCILFGHVFQLVPPNMQDEYDRTTYVLAVSLDLWFLFTYCTLWVVNEDRTIQAKVCCLVSFLCGMLEFVAISSLITFFFSEGADEYVWVSKISTLCQCFLHAVTLYGTRGIVDVTHIAGGVVSLFFIVVPASSLIAPSPSMVYLGIVVFPAITTMVATAKDLGKNATSSIYNFVSFLLCLMCTLIKYTHFFFLCVFANNMQRHHDFFAYELSSRYPSVFSHYRERLLAVALLVLGAALAHLWRSGEFTSLPTDGFSMPCEYEAKLGSPKRCPPTKYAVSNSNVRPMGQNGADCIPGSCPVEECIICFDSMRSVILEPCQHLVACTDCSERIVEKKSNPMCPLCRAPITELLVCQQESEGSNVLICDYRRTVTLCPRFNELPFLRDVIRDDDRRHTTPESFTRSPVPERVDFFAGSPSRQATVPPLVSSPSRDSEALSVRDTSVFSAQPVFNSDALPGASDNVTPSASSSLGSFASPNARPGQSSRDSDVPGRIASRDSDVPGRISPTEADLDVIDLENGNEGFDASKSSHDIQERTPASTPASRSVAQTDEVENAGEIV